MQSFTLDQEAPVPKSINIEVPSYTVPDATCMFDENDSLIWNASQWKKLNNSSKCEEKPATTVLRPGSIINSEPHYRPLPLSFLKQNIVRSPKYVDDFEDSQPKSPIYITKSTTRTVQEEYNPLHYSTSNSPKESPLKEKEIDYLLKENFVANKHKIVGKEKNKNVKVDPNKILNESLTTSSPKVSLPNNNVDHDKYFEVIQRQNEQIMQLHDMLNQLLAKNINNNSPGEADNIKQKQPPKTVSIGTNTDLTWLDIECNNCRNKENEVQPVYINKDLRLQNIGDNRNTPAKSVKPISNFDSVNEKNLDMQLKQARLSNISKKTEDVQYQLLEEKRSIHDQDELEHPDDEAHQLTNHAGNEVMFYNNVMINIQQILKKNNPEGTGKIGEAQPYITRYEKTNFVNIPTSSICHPTQVDQCLQSQEEDFSLLKSMAIVENNSPQRLKGSPRGRNYPLGDPEDLNLPFLRAQKAAFGVERETNSAAFAQDSVIKFSEIYKQSWAHQRIHSPTNLRTIARDPLRPRAETDFSMATKSFLNRYDLKF